MQISVLQCQSSRDVKDNLRQLESQLNQLQTLSGEPHLVVLPECVCLFGGHEKEQLAHAGELTAGLHMSELKQALAELARRFQVWLVAGTIPALAEDGRVYSRCYLFDDQGGVQGQYDKMHLFDVEVADGTRSYRESDTFCPGEQISVIDTPFGRLGLAICYDVRFPDLFRALRLAGAEIIALPSAFTAVTGEAHWQTLIQARALDSQCFILAADQWGRHNQGSRETWGQSMIVDPWGRILAQMAEGVGWVEATLDFEELTRVRRAMPIVSHNRFEAPKLKSAPTK
ncbi:carbon-nitrogen hydrolase family protein [Shewanella submarina]|uniref:Carbon-nitrogen hydrolase family protein n=1 Tax=Shewanella submarina TaxID=2016376 RepID=A0ABV7GIC8_9GAMM|nr:carbon-nitrogen hydrolase family protein [Shewanella submarina]MCL1035630.1 carbon-nitrogen hydrolase family protein [Shewanella submarina]